MWSVQAKRTKNGLSLVVAGECPNIGTSLGNPEVSADGIKIPINESSSGDASLFSGSENTPFSETLSVVGSFAGDNTKIRIPGFFDQVVPIG